MKDYGRRTADAAAERGKLLEEEVVLRGDVLFVLN
jgi:hypothetical protein